MIPDHVTEWHVRHDGEWKATCVSENAAFAAILDMQGQWACKWEGWSIWKVEPDNTETKVDVYG